MVVENRQLNMNKVRLKMMKINKKYIPLSKPRQTGLLWLKSFNFKRRSQIARLVGITKFNIKTSYWNFNGLN